MSDEEIRVRCVAITQSGRRCRNVAQPGSHYCHAHQELAHEAAPANRAAAASEGEQMAQLVTELDDLVAELKDTVPEGGVSPYSPLHFLRLLRQNVDEITPETIKEMRESFEGATVEDLLDPDTWKGMGYMLNYSLQFQLEKLRERLLGEEGMEE